MATNMRRRSATGSQSGWNRTGTTNKRQTTTKRGTYGKRPAHGYEQCYNGFNHKINSYKMLYTQTFGTAKHTRPTATVLNTFANWINKGAVIQTVSCAKVARWARTTKCNFNTRNATVTGCKSVLWNKFGKTTIKAVARTKTGSYMVATMPTWKGKPFTFPH